MRCVRLGVLWCWLWLMLSTAHAVDLIALPALQQPVTDLTQTLSAEEQASLNQTLTQFSQQTGAQIAVLILPTTQPEDIAQFGIRLADAWKLGRAKEDDGVIVIVAKQDRKMRIEVGYGLEGAIPDAIAKRVIAEQLAPAFKRDQFYQGLAAATQTLMQLIQGEHLPPPTPVKAGQAGALNALFPLLMFAAIAIGWIARSLLGSFLGSAFTGGVLAVVAGVLGATLVVMLLVALATFVFSLAMASGLVGMPSGYQGGGGRGADLFRGGGGGFGGGGASGDW